MHPMHTYDNQKIVFYGHPPVSSFLLFFIVLFLSVQKVSVRLQHAWYPFAFSAHGIVFSTHGIRSSSVSVRHVCCSSFSLCSSPIFLHHIISEHSSFVLLFFILFYFSFSVFFFLMLWLVLLFSRKPRTLAFHLLYLDELRLFGFRFWFWFWFWFLRCCTAV